MIATSRYPNELIRLSKVVRRLGHTLYLITDSKLCPLIPFANETLIAPSKSISLIGSPTAILCIANYIALGACRTERGQRHGLSSGKTGEGLSGKRHLVRFECGKALGMKGRSNRRRVVRVGILVTKDLGGIRVGRVERALRWVSLACCFHRTLLLSEFERTN